MRRKRRVLAIMAFATLLSCNAYTIPATTPTIETVELDIQSTPSLSPLVRDLTQQYQGQFPDFSFNIQINNYASLLHKIDVDEAAYVITSQLPDEEKWAVPIAQDGIAMIVHPDNLVSDLTLEQIRQIYLGSITNWQQLGGDDVQITVLSQNVDADSRIEFERMVMGRRRTTANAELVPSESAMLERVAEKVGTIGYVSFALVSDTVKPIAVNSVVPSVATITDSTYPLRSTIFVVGLQEPSSDYLAFIQWIQSVEGQKIVIERYAPLPPN